MPFGQTVKLIRGGNLGVEGYLQGLPQPFFVQPGYLFFFYFPALVSVHQISANFILF